MGEEESCISVRGLSFNPRAGEMYTGEKPNPGDHIRRKRRDSKFIYHHGIYIGENECEVIHMSGNGKSNIGAMKNAFV